MNIYEQLKSGRSAEELAASFTEELNRAQKAIDQEKAEAAKAAEVAERAKRMAAKLREKKKESLRNVVDAFVTHLTTYYPGLGITKDEEWMDGMTEILGVTIDMELGRFSAKAETKREEKKDDPFASFFATFGL